MLSLWNHLHQNKHEESREQDSDFCPPEDLWLKVAEAKSEETMGTLSFSQDVIGQFLEIEDSNHSE